MKWNHDMSIICVQQRVGKNGIGVSLPELELSQYIFDEVDPTHFRFPPYHHKISSPEIECWEYLKVHLPICFGIFVFQNSESAISLKSCSRIPKATLQSNHDPKSYYLPPTNDYLLIKRGQYSKTDNSHALLGVMIMHFFGEKIGLSTNFGSA